MTTCKIYRFLSKIAFMSGAALLLAKVALLFSALVSNISMPIRANRLLLKHLIEFGEKEWNFGLGYTLRGFFQEICIKELHSVKGFPLCH